MRIATVLAVASVVTSVFGAVVFENPSPVEDLVKRQASARVRARRSIEDVQLNEIVKRQASQRVRAKRSIEDEDLNNIVKRQASARVRAKRAFEDVELNEIVKRQASARVRAKRSIDDEDLNNIVKRQASQRVRLAKKDEVFSGSAQDSLNNMHCPTGETACPIGSDFECIDVVSTLDSCGGCLGAGGVDCLAIPGALGVSCVDAKCEVMSCFPGWTFRDGACVRN